MHLNIPEVKKIIVSQIERQDIGGKVTDQRAIEVFTEDRKFLITLEGPDLQLYNEKGGNE